MTAAPSYVAVHRYDGAAIQHEQVETAVPCAVQPRDVAILRDVWRHKFLTAPQVLELWWPGKRERAGQRRLRLLFEPGTSRGFARSRGAGRSRGPTSSRRRAIACCSAPA